MNICIICDTHLQLNEKTPQFAYLKKAIDKIKEDGITTLIHLGDIVSYGQIEPFEKYFNLTSFIKDNHYVLGNAEIRDEKSVSYFLDKRKSEILNVNGKKIFLINTPYAEIYDDDVKLLSNCEDGDIIMAHHSLPAIRGKNKEFLENLLKDKKLTFIHAHSHCKFDYTFGKSRVIGLRALDPDKSIGDYPCINYINFDKEVKVKEVLFKTNVTTLKEIKNYFGFSCSCKKDILDAINYGVKNIEIKLKENDLTNSEGLIDAVNEWKKATNGYLSIHMPNIIYEEGCIKNLDNFKLATSIVNKVKANGVTLHPPRVIKGVLYGNNKVYEELLNVYVDFVNSIDRLVNVGLENVHLKKTEIGLNDGEIGFGYTPLEVEKWVNSINNKLCCDRVKYVLDVGHIQNNRKNTSIYPTSSWYAYLSKNIIAYHIHQVLKTENGLKNHNPITSWFGPLISYASFFYCFENDIISKAPMFLEIKKLGIDGYLQSVNAFNKLLD